MRVHRILIQNIMQEYRGTSRTRIRGDNMGDPNVTMKMKMFELRISNTQLAEKVGVSKGTISLILNGRTDPSLQTALKIARELGVRVEDLWSIEEDESR